MNNERNRWLGFKTASLRDAADEPTGSLFINREDGVS